jgi:hypothetical protein
MATIRVKNHARPRQREKEITTGTVAVGLDGRINVIREVDGCPHEVFSVIMTAEEVASLAISLVRHIAER